MSQRIVPALMLALAGCDLLGPRASDITADAPVAVAPTTLLPPGAVVPSIAGNAELLSQIKINDGLSDNALAMADGVVVRSAGKAAGVPVMYWNFGAAALADNFAASAPLYVLANDNGDGTFSPRADHPWLVDGIPGDPRYSAIRRIIYIPVTPAYAGEVIPSVAALDEALERGLVGEPVPAGTWRNMPIVPPETRLELGGTAEPMAATEVYGRGYRIPLFPLGGALGIQPLRNGSPPMAQEARLFSGVVTGTPPSLSSTPDAQPVFQFGIPSGAPTTAFNYTPIVVQVDVRLADGVDPAMIASDAAMFRRATNGSIAGFYTGTVDGYSITTTVGNKQIQFVEGAP